MPNSDSQSVIARCRELAGISEMPGGTLRTFLSPAMKRCYDKVGEWMIEAGLNVTVDGAGNLRGVLSGGGSQNGTLLLGSHLDTVRDAGAFDGILGVVMAIALAERFRDTPLPFALEVIGFSEEEGVRFGVPFIGSRGLVGSLDEQTLQRADADGVTVERALRDFGLDPGLSNSLLPASPAGYLEVHIEQGPVLENAGESIGVVETIAGQSRGQATFRGAANHAGTTPMHLRRDALAAAAEWISAVEQFAQSTPGLVATNGKIDAKPGVGNVIAGEVTVSLDVRHADDKSRDHAYSDLSRAAVEIAGRRRVELVWTDFLNQKAVRLDRWLTELLATAGVSGVRRMVSGAGHDAMILAPHVPTAMLFLRSPGGISHHPSEDVLPGDVDLALAVGQRFIETLSREHGAL